MKAWIVEHVGGPEVLTLADIPAPQAKADEVKIRVRAFGLNRAEVYRRTGMMGPIDSPAVPGIEAAGEVISDASGTFRTGQRVATAMGGMQFSRPGSYAEEVAVLRSNVIDLHGTTLSWEELAALPESYLTVWGAVGRSLGLAKGQTLLVRGATAALGLAATAYAKSLGAKVVATTRSEAKRSASPRGGRRRRHRGPGTNRRGRAASFSRGCGCCPRGRRRGDAARHHQGAEAVRSRGGRRPPRRPAGVGELQPDAGSPERNAPQLLPQRPARHAGSTAHRRAAESNRRRNLCRANSIAPRAHLRLRRRAASARPDGERSRPWEAGHTAVTSERVANCQVRQMAGAWSHPLPAALRAPLAQGEVRPTEDGSLRKAREERRAGEKIPSGVDLNHLAETSGMTQGPEPLESIRSMISLLHDDPRQDGEGCPVDM